MRPEVEVTFFLGLRPATTSRGHVAARDVEHERRGVGGTSTRSRNASPSACPFSEVREAKRARFLRVVRRSTMRWPSGANERRGNEPPELAGIGMSGRFDPSMTGAPVAGHPLAKRWDAAPSHGFTARGSASKVVCDFSFLCRARENPNYPGQKRGLFVGELFADGVVGRFSPTLQRAFHDGPLQLVEQRSFELIAASGFSRKGPLAGKRLRLRVERSDSTDLRREDGRASETSTRQRPSVPSRGARA